MKKIFYILVILNLILLPEWQAGVTVLSQHSITWNRLYEGGYYQPDFGYGLCKTTDGNYVLGGETTYLGAMMVKIDAYGNTIWMNHYPNNGCQALASTSDGGVVFASPHLTKINSVGDTLWTQRYLQENIINLYDIIQCTDGGYFTCGRAYYDSGYVMKTDSQGNFLWKQMITDSVLTVRLFAVSEAYSNGYLVAGLKWNLYEYDPVIGKFGVNGERIWIKTYGEGDSLGYGIRIIKQPPFYLVACGLGYMKIDDQGNVITAKLLPRDPDYGIRDLQFVTNDKFVMVTNNLAIIGTCLTKIYIIDTNNNILNSKAVNFSYFVRLKKIQFAGNGDIIFGGDAVRDDTTYLDIYALRTDGSLNFPPIDIQNISEEVPVEFYLYQNYPNPFNPITKINYELPFTSFTVLKIYDYLGREVETLVNQIQEAGKYEVQWDGTNYSSGVYFYRIIEYKLNNQKGLPEFIKAKSMVLLK